MSTRMERRVVPKIGDYTIKAAVDRPGTCFTNRGATGAVVFTLPTPNLALKGWWYRFKGYADFAISVKTAAIDTMVGLNDIAAKSVATAAASHIGGELEAFCDGTSWFVSGVAVGHTYTLTA